MGGSLGRGAVLRPARAQAAEGQTAKGGRATLPLGRLLLLPLVAFLVAVAVQIGLKTAGLPAESLLRVLATPFIAAVVVYLGLRPYPRAGRIRLAAMVAAGLLLVALAT